MSSHSETREMPVYVVRPASGVKQSLVEGTDVSPMQIAISKSDNGNKVYIAGKGPMGSFLQNLRSLLKRPIVDETNMKGIYSFELEFDGGGEATLGAIRNQLGLEVVASIRPVTVLVIDRITPLATGY